uniref:Uncharacterized protein n=1 Tax=Pararge aegeria TaxID=116150 RepID=S4PSZ6_9NEOP
MMIVVTIKALILFSVHTRGKSRAGRGIEVSFYTAFVPTTYYIHITYIDFLKLIGRGVLSPSKPGFHFDLSNCTSFQNDWTLETFDASFATDNKRNAFFVFNIIFN